MKKIYFLAGLAAMTLASCSNSDGPEAQLKAPETTQAQQTIGFEAYINRGLTRAGDRNDIITDNLKTSGFGVFGYYTNNNNYDGTSIPNFMYNEKVSGDAWGYEPIKYWPNEYGENAASDETDKLSFFAYAPYVEVDPATGRLTNVSAGEDTWGITCLSRNNFSGDPIVKYIGSFSSDKAVDLIWGHVQNTGDLSWALTNGGTAQSLKAGLPWLDVERPAGVDNKVKFVFDHALARMQWTVDTYADKEDATDNPKADTKVYIRSITFEGFAMKGALNLNNTTACSATASNPLWLTYDGTQDLETGNAYTLFDGRKDGKEGAQVAGSEKPTGLNPVLIQDNLWASSGAGVTGTPVNLFQSTGDFFYVIPTGDKLTVKIVYDIETKDTNLATYLSDGKEKGSSIENVIYKEITLAAGKLEAGKSYKIALHLGMQSVKFDAEVTAWPVTPEDNSAELPANKND